MMVPTHRSLAALAAAGALLILLVPAARSQSPAGGVIGLHNVDGQFNPLEWDVTRSTVSKTTFPVIGFNGGANLFVEQNGAVLDLMYDYVNSGNTLHNDPTSFFDVFFEVASSGDDYLVRINAGTNQFTSFERTHGSLAPLLADGTFDVSAGSGWSALSTADLNEARFKTAIGFGHDPASPSDPDHLLAEFELSINRPGSPGLYDPSPAFWSASAAKTGSDPPISSAIFQLDPDGGTLVTPVYSADGGPAQRPQDVAPEGGSLMLIAAGIIPILIGIARRRR
jgi:hypothetical protein